MHLATTYVEIDAVEGKRPCGTFAEPRDLQKILFGIRHSSHYARDRLLPRGRDFLVSCASPFRPRPLQARDVATIRLDKRAGSIVHRPLRGWRCRSTFHAPKLQVMLLVVVARNEGVLVAAFCVHILGRYEIWRLHKAARVLFLKGAVKLVDRLVALHLIRPDAVTSCHCPPARIRS